MDKICPKCQNVHTRHTRFCSRKCSNSRTFSEESKKLKSEKYKKWLAENPDKRKSTRIYDNLSQRDRIIQSEQKLKEHLEEILNWSEEQKQQLKQCPTCGIKHGLGKFCSLSCSTDKSKINKQTHSCTLNRKFLQTLTNEQYEQQVLLLKKYNLDLNKDHIPVYLKITTDFEKLSDESQRKLLLLEQNNKCYSCGIDSWNNLPISLELEHINGNHRDKRKENTIMLCPNCHSQTHTWRGRNKCLRTTPVSDEEFVAALEKHTTIRAALLSLNIAAKGNNYQRAKTIRNQQLLKKRQELEQGIPNNMDTIN